MVGKRQGVCHVVVSARQEAASLTRYKRAEFLRFAPVANGNGHAASFLVGDLNGLMTTKCVNAIPSALFGDRQGLSKQLG